jgi:hypothetical protein
MSQRTLVSRSTYDSLPLSRTKLESLKSKTKPRGIAGFVRMIIACYNAVKQSFTVNKAWRGIDA